MAVWNINLSKASPVFQHSISKAPAGRFEKRRQGERFPAKPAFSSFKHARTDKDMADDELWSQIAEVLGGAQVAVTNCIWGDTS
jgi:hypothetical protein